MGCWTRCFLTLMSVLAHIAHCRPKLRPRPPKRGMYTLSSSIAANRASLLRCPLKSLYSNRNNIQRNTNFLVLPEEIAFQLEVWDDSLPRIHFDLRFNNYRKLCTQNIRDMNTFSWKISFGARPFQRFAFQQSPDGPVQFTSLKFKYPARPLIKLISPAFNFFCFLEAVAEVFRWKPRLLGRRYTIVFALQHVNTGNI